MQKWEFCYLINMNQYPGPRDTGAISISFPGIGGIHFTDIKDFLKHKNRPLSSDLNLLCERISILLSDLEKWEPDYGFITNMIIKALGESGWEIVGCGSTCDTDHHIYFKRPIEGK